MRYLLPFLFVVFYTIVTAQVKPEWVSNHPLDSNYYIGIANCEKNMTNYMECAKNNALESIASGIMIKIASESTYYSKEDNQKVNSNFSTNTKTQTFNELEGYELVGTWHDSRFYWVYYRLSKIGYSTLLKEKTINDYNISNSFYVEGLKQLQNYDYANALSSFIQAYRIIQPNLTRPTVIEVTSKSWVLSEQTIKQISELLSNLHIVVNSNEIKVQYGKSIKTSIKASVCYKDIRGKQTYVPQIPVRFRFEKGAGMLSDSIVRTDKQGLVTNSLLRVTSPESMQSVICEIAIEPLTSGYSKLAPLQSITAGNISRVRFSISVEKVMVKINTIEQNNGESLAPKIIEPVLINFLKSNGFNITPNPKEAEYSISINANTRKGTQMNGICTSFLDVHITLHDNAGNIIFSHSKSGLKGLKLNYHEAGLDSYKRNIDTIEKELFQLMLNKLLSE